MYSVDEKDYVVTLPDLPRPTAGAGEPALFASEYVLQLAYYVYAKDDAVALVTFEVQRMRNNVIDLSKARSRQRWLRRSRLRIHRSGTAVQHVIAVLVPGVASWIAVAFHIARHREFICMHCGEKCTVRV
jgi:hypothetical protein